MNPRFGRRGVGADRDVPAFRCQGSIAALLAGIKMRHVALTTMAELLEIVNLVAKAVESKSMSRGEEWRLVLPSTVV